MSKIKLYAQPLPGIYKHSSIRWLYGVKKFAKTDIRVLVLGETDKQYKIRLLEPTTTRNASDELFVQKKSVKIEYFNAEEARCVFYDDGFNMYKCLNCSTANCINGIKIRRKYYGQKK